MALVKGIAPAMLTSWGADDLYDSKTQEKYVDWLIANGVSAVIVAGSTGENMAMMQDEQKAIIEHVAKYVDHRVPVYAGTGKYSTTETIMLSQHAEAVGVDALMVLVPYYFKPTLAAAMDHYRELHRNCGLPLICYNNPNFAGIELNPAQVKQLNDEGVIEGVKVAHGDPERVSSIKYACGDNITAYYGHDFAALHGFAAGADGWLSGVPSAFPKQCRELFDAIVVEKDLAKGQKVWEKFIPFTDFFFDPVVQAQIHWLPLLKWAVTIQGIPLGLPRKPLGELDAAAKKRLEEVVTILVS